VDATLRMKTQKLKNMLEKLTALRKENAFTKINQELGFSRNTYKAVMLFIAAFAIYVAYKYYQLFKPLL